MIEIKGLPEGWLATEFAVPKIGEFYFNPAHGIVKSKEQAKKPWCIVVPKPKQYRPFKNAAEYTKNRHRWIQFVSAPEDAVLRVIGYSNAGIEISSGHEITVVSYDQAFEILVFDDGSPFGIED